MPKIWRCAVIYTRPAIRRQVCHYFLMEGKTPGVVNFLVSKKDAWELESCGERLKVTIDGKIIHLEDKFPYNETITAVIVVCPKCKKGAQVRQGEHSDHYLSCPYCGHSAKEAAVYFAKDRECWPDWLRFAYRLFLSS